MIQHGGLPIERKPAGCADCRPPYGDDAAIITVSSSTKILSVKKRSIMITCDVEGDCCDHWRTQDADEGRGGWRCHGSGARSHRRVFYSNEILRALTPRARPARNDTAVGAVVDRRLSGTPTSSRHGRYWGKSCRRSSVRSERPQRALISVGRSARERS